VEIAWIFDIVRGGPDAARLLAGADYATSAAIEHQRDGVIALGLAGMESGFPPEPFAPWFERARTAGLHCIPHAGEHAGPASIWGALHALGAERIAHGVRAIEDAELVEYLAQQRIALEVCPSSNVCLGVYPSLTEHPLRRLYDAGVPLTINTDDPPLFDTSLDGEVLSLATVFGLDVAAIDEILLNGVRYCFLPEARRRALEGDFRTELAALKRTHLPDTGL